MVACLAEAASVERNTIPRIRLPIPQRSERVEGKAEALPLYLTTPGLACRKGRRATIVLSTWARARTGISGSCGWTRRGVP